MKNVCLPKCPVDRIKPLFLVFIFSIPLFGAYAQGLVDAIHFTRQGARRLVFNEKQTIPLAVFEPGDIVGMPSMHPVNNWGGNPEIKIEGGKLFIGSGGESISTVWLGGFNPFATYAIDLDTFAGNGEIGLEFTDMERSGSFCLKVKAENGLLAGAMFEVTKGSKNIIQKEAGNDLAEGQALKGRLVLQMLGSGFVLYLQDEGLPLTIAQGDFNKYVDLRGKKYIQTYHANIYVHLREGKAVVNNAEVGFSTGSGLADIRAITYENGEPILDGGRIWYTMSIRGRALPHHIQGVFSMDPSVFDIKFEGIIVFDRDDGILRNEVASHIFYDRKDEIWRGLTTGFSAFANPEKEEKQLLAVESAKDPRFGFSVMAAKPFGMVGDIEDPHIIYDEGANKWRMLTCENTGEGYKAILMESDYWDKGYVKIAGPVSHNSTGTSIQKIGRERYCFSGSSERKVFVYTYPGLKEAGPLKMDLPPWDGASGTRIWPNVVQLPEGYFCKYVALMMDRYNYPGLKGPNWTYGALYLYHGY